VSLLFFLFFLFSPKPVFASNTVIISNYSASSDPESVELTNTTDINIRLVGWVIRNNNNNNTSDNISLSGTLSSYSKETFTHVKGWLNNGDGGIYLYDQNNKLIDELIYPTPTITPTSTPTPTPTIYPTPTITPTPDSTTINPSSGIILTEFMPYSSIEWIELYNQNDFDVKLSNWQIGNNSSNIKNISPDLVIKAKSYATFDFSGLLNNNGDKVVLYDNNKKIITSYTYNDNAFDLERSWSSVNGSWCQTDITKGNANVNYCLNSATPTPTSSPTTVITPISTPTPDLNRYQPSPEATADSALSVSSPDSTADSENPTDTPTPTVGSVLGETASPTKTNFLPLIFIVSGGILLSSPFVITKIKNAKNKNKDNDKNSNDE
jgi:hypothetical protein